MFLKKTAREQRGLWLALQLGAPILLLGLGAGCASTSVFNAYPKQVSPIIQEVKEGKPVDLGAAFSGKVQSKDKILYLMERGRIAQIQGHTEASKSDFKAAIDAINANDQKALVTASGGAAQTAAIALNDNAIPYEGYGYERVFVHHYQAWNYLVSGDLEGAGVELRIARAEQDSALKAHEKEVASAMREAKAKQIDVPLENPELSKSFSAMDKTANLVKNSFQNAYTFYLSGLVWEILKEENDAYIDYKKALEIFPGNDYLQRNVLRLAIKLEMIDDIERFKSLYPNAYRAVSEGGLRFNLGISEAEFNAWLEKMRYPFERKDKAAFLSVVAEFREACKKNPDSNRIEKALSLQLRTAERFASWFANGLKWGITEVEFNKWVNKLRLPYEKKDKAVLQGVTTEFHKAYSNNPDEIQIETAMVAKLKESTIAPGVSPNDSSISEAAFNTWLEKLRIPYERKEKARLQAVVAEFREVFKACPDVVEAERALVQRLKLMEHRKTLVFGTNPISGCELVVLFEDDFVPQKQEIKIALPVPRVKSVVAAAFPVYNSTGCTIVPLSVSDNRGTLGNTEPICYVGAMAIKALKEKIPVIITRQMIRTTTKALASKAINDGVRSRGRNSQDAMAGALVDLIVTAGTSIYNIVTENADLRSWTTLPNAVQIMRVNLPPGANSIRFVHSASGAAGKVDIDAKLGGKVVVCVVRAGGKIYCNPLNF